MRAKVDDAEIYFDVDGMGLAPDADRMVERPVLFLLHGGPGGDHSSFKLHSEPLRDTAQMVFVDHRGSGRSTVVAPESCTLDQNIDDVDALRRHLGIQASMRVSIAFFSSDQ